MHHRMPPSKTGWPSRLSKFWIFFGVIQMISCRDWWPWTKHGYITMTRRQSNNQWSGGIATHPAPKSSDCKNTLEKFSPRFFGIKTASSSLIIFQRTKLSTRSITHLCWCNWRTFWRKNAAGSSPTGSSSCMTMPRLTGHLQPRNNWPTWASSVLITHPITPGVKGSRPGRTGVIRLPRGDAGGLGVRGSCYSPRAVDENYSLSLPKTVCAWWRAISYEWWPCCAEHSRSKAVKL